VTTARACAAGRRRWSRGGGRRRGMRVRRSWARLKQIRVGVCAII
jgi:hypothetical protein